MSLAKYLDTISKLEPERIYVENVRSITKLPTFLAKGLCEMAVSDGYFTKHIGVICPNENCKRIVKVIDFDEEVPSKLCCEVCEAEGLDYEFNSSQCETVLFYRLEEATK
jgi:hypothetical protein